MKWLKKWSYLIILTGAGILYLSCVDGWQVYAKPLTRLKEQYEVRDERGAEDAGEQGDTGEEEKDAVSAESTPPPPESEEGSDRSSEGGVENTAEGGTAPEGGEASEPEGESGEGAGGASAGSASDEEPENGKIAYMTVEDDYFSDAVFIGDSRTVGMFEYGELEETAAFYASTGLTVYKMFDSAIVQMPGARKKITIEEALQQNSFAKIYLMIGINEMGTGTVDSFIEAYAEAVEHLRELQPDAIIYLQGIIKVTEERSAQGDYINNEGIIARNERIEELADGVKTFYLDVNPLICDESGGMAPDYTFDGVHLKAKYIGIWKDYLKTHAISS